MSLPDVMLISILFILVIVVAIIIRYAVIWHRNIHYTNLRLNKIEKEIEQLPGKCPISESMTHPRLSLPEAKPGNAEAIRHYLNIYHPYLIDKIMQFSKEKLSNSDELLCTMIKLGYSNKEIGMVLSISKSSVLTARYRLKRKIGFPQEQQLDDWILRIE